MLLESQLIVVFLMGAQILHLHSWWSSLAATCAGGVFLQNTSAFTDAYCNLHCVVVVVLVVVFLCCGGDCMWCWLYTCSLHKGTTSMQILPLCYLHLVAASRSYRLVAKVVLTLCNLRWWCFSFHQLAQILHLHSWWSSPAATCTGGVFLQSTSACTDVHIATCTVW